MTIVIHMASSDADIDVARDLCRDWLDWHWANYPDGWPTEGNPMDRDRFQGILADLPSIHGRPSGGILLAYLEGEPVGCVMYNQAQPGVAEFNRMFVTEPGRGHGIGRRLLDHMFVQMREDGYETVMFSSARFLTHARAMYEAAGFLDTPHPDGFPPEWVPYVYFMVRPLGA